MGFIYELLELTYKLVEDGVFHAQISAYVFAHTSLLDWTGFTDTNKRFQ